MQVLVYLDEGADPHSVRMAVKALRRTLPSHYQIRRVNHTTIIEEDWKYDTFMLLMPGGRDRPYHRDLSGIGTKKIREFVEGGGRYLGLCAGGYFGASIVDFERGYPLEVYEKRELEFFPGVARGTVYNPGTFEYDSEANARLAVLSGDISTHACFFNGGCEFVDADAYPGITVLSRYDDLESKPAAIVHCRVENGEAILCGVHPEHHDSDSKLFRLLLHRLIDSSVVL